MVKLVPAFVALTILGCGQARLPSPSDDNIYVNEHSFLKVCEDGSDTGAEDVLGQPCRRGNGQIMRYFTNRSDTNFTISEEPSDESDFFEVWHARNGEEIRVLYSARNRQLMAAEYIFNGVSIYYFGLKPMHDCKVAPLVEASGGKDWSGASDPAPSPELALRKRTIVDFLHRQEVRSRSGAITHNSAVPKSSPETPSNKKARNAAAMTAAAAPPTASDPPPAGAVPTQPQFAPVPPRFETASGVQAWTDANGSHAIDAEFADFDADGVLLKKSDGATIHVPFDKLSAASRKLVDLAVSERNEQIFTVMRAGHNSEESVSQDLLPFFHKRVRLVGRIDGKKSQSQQLVVNFFLDGWPGTIAGAVANGSWNFRRELCIKAPFNRAFDKIEPGEDVVFEGDLRPVVQDCPLCNGKDLVKCPKCGGSGEVKGPPATTVAPLPGGLKMRSTVPTKVTCPICGGKRKVPCNHRVVYKDWFPFVKKTKDEPAATAIAAITFSEGKHVLFICLDNLSAKVPAAEGDLLLGSNVNAAK